jgi:DNA polymerase elongation subunit (family B)
MTTTLIARKLIQYTEKLAMSTRVAFPYDISVKEVVYGDTDSIMPKLPCNLDVQCTEEKKVELIFEYITLLAASITSQLRDFHFPQTYGHWLDLEAECYWKDYLLVVKKKYTGNYKEKPSDPYTRVSTGLLTVRRDTWTLMKDTYSQCIDQYFATRDKTVLEILERGLQKLAYNKVDVQDVVMGKQYNPEKVYASTKHEHLVVVKKKRQRNPNIQLPGRIQYVIVYSKSLSPVVSVCLRAECPEYFQDSGDGLYLDTVYYLNHMKKQMVDLLALFGLKEHCKLLFQRYENIALNFQASKCNAHSLDTAPLKCDESKMYCYDLRVQKSASSRTHTFTSAGPHKQPVKQKKKAKVAQKTRPKTQNLQTMFKRQKKI